MNELGSMLIFLLAGGTVGIFAVVLAPRWWLNRPTARTARRMVHYARAGKAVATAGPLFRAGSIFENETKNALERINASVSNLFANIGGGPSLRRLSLLALAAGLAALATTTLWLGWEFALALAAAIGAGVTVLGVGYVQLKRRWQVAFLDNLADAIDLVIRAVRSGIPVVEAIRTAGQEIQDPVRREFQRISDAMDLGIDLKVALREAAVRIRLSDFDFFVITLVIQRESGGQLTDTLEGLSIILRRRKELRLKVKAMTAEGRMSALIVGGMPIVAGGAMYAIDPNQIGRLFEPGTGQTMLTIALGLMALGILIVHQLTKVKP